MPAAIVIQPDGSKLAGIFRPAQEKIEVACQGAAGLQRLPEIEKPLLLVIRHASACGALGDGKRQ